MTIEMAGQTWRAVGLNDWWRLSKYYAGARFRAHVDSAVDKSDTLRSMFTVNIYLNGGFDGGATRFFVGTKSRMACGTAANPPVCAVVPRAGDALVFRQPPGADYMHDGEELRSGVKYLLRSDVMYERASSG